MGPALDQPAVGRHLNREEARLSRAEMTQEGRCGDHSGVFAAERESDRIAGAELAQLRVGLDQSHPHGGRQDVDDDRSESNDLPVDLCLDENLIVNRRLVACLDHRSGRLFDARSLSVRTNRLGRGGGPAPNIPPTGQRALPGRRLGPSIGESDPQTSVLRSARGHPSLRPSTPRRVSGGRPGTIPGLGWARLRFEQKPTARTGPRGGHGPRVR